MGLKGWIISFKKSPCDQISIFKTLIYEIYRINKFYGIDFWEMYTVTYRLHVLKYIVSLPRRRHFHRNKCIFKMSIMVPYGSHKLFRFVLRRFEEKLPKICDFWLCQRVKKCLWRLYYWPHLAPLKRILRFDDNYGTFNDSS